MMPSMPTIQFGTTAIVLAIAAATPAASQTNGSRPFWPEIRAFIARDNANGIVPCRTLFVGSSSIRLWTAIASDIPARKIVRRGFGGGKLSHVRQYYEILVARHQPHAIVLYAGENDISGGATPAAVVAELEALLDIKRRSLGATPVYFIAIKPSVRRWHERATQAKANALIKRLAVAHRDLVFIDIVRVMLENGRPKRVYQADGLHLSRVGYRLWAREVNAALDSADVSTSPHCQKKRRSSN